MRTEDSGQARFIEFQDELRKNLPDARKAFDAFQADPSNWKHLDDVRNFFHRIAGVAKPLGAAVVGQLAMMAEDAIVLLSSGKGEVGPTSLRLLSAGLTGVEFFISESTATAPMVPTSARLFTSAAKEVLIIDDDPLSAKVTEMCLGEAGYTTRYCAEPSEAVAMLKKDYLPDLILLDLLMPGQDGFETCRQIRAVATYDRIPVIFLTRINDVAERVEALGAGGDDYLTKPFAPEELIAHVRSHITRHEAQREQLAIDDVSGAFTRRYFLQRLKHELRVAGTSGQPLCAALIDLDYFKHINELHGHVGGDSALAGVTRISKAVMGAQNVVARFGGDEFAVLMPNCHEGQAIKLLEQILIAVRTTKLGREVGREIQMTLSLGVAQALAGEESTALLDRADSALYESKTHGRNRITVAPVELPGDKTVPAAMAARPALTARILLVDDSRLTREVLKLYLMPINVEIRHAENGEAALQQIRAEPPNLVIADYRMPKLDGLGLCRAVLEDPAVAHVPIIIVTGHLDPELYAACKSAGAKAVLAKPLEPIDLLSTVNKHLRRTGATE